MRMACEMCTHQLVVPRPFVFGISGGVNPNKTAPCLDESFKGSLLIRIQNIAGGIVENDSFVLLEVEVVEKRRILCCVNEKPVLAAQLENCLDAAGNRSVLPSLRL